MQNAIKKLIDAGRGSGAFDLQDRQLTEVPAGMFEEDDTAGLSWWQVAEPTKITLLHNQIQSLPPELCALDTLNVLDISHNQLAELPADISNLSALKLLDVSHNAGLSQLPDSITLLAGLVRLACNAAGLSQLPPGLGCHQPALAEVLAADNCLSCLPEGLCGCSSLVVLDLQGSHLQQLPGSLCTGAKMLRQLQVDRNRLQYLPAELGSLTALQVLHARENGLQELPASMGDCSRLIELHLGFNSLRRLPSSLSSLQQLRVLDVRNNSLTAVPPHLCSLRLTLLDLSNNDISRLPPELGLMTSLRSLPLAGNPLRGLRSNLASGPISHLLRHLASQLPMTDFEEDSPSVLAAESVRKLALGMPADKGLSVELSTQGLQEVPSEVWQQAGRLHKLDLSCNALAGSYQHELAACRGLATLLLQRNQFPAWPLPASPGTLGQLQQLQVAYNPIQSLPAQAFAACCSALTDLDLSGLLAAAKDLAATDLARCSRLERVCLAQCGLAAFPPPVLQLQHLQTLQLQDNKISEVPEALTCLHTLDTIDLTNNSVVHLPSRLGLMTNLRALALEGNILKTIRRPVLARGTQAVLSCLRDRIPA